MRTIEQADGEGHSEAVKVATALRPAWSAFLPNTHRALIYAWTSRDHRTEPAGRGADLPALVRETGRAHGDRRHLQSGFTRAHLGDNYGSRLTR